MSSLFGKTRTLLVISALTVILSAGFCFSSIAPEIDITHYEYGKIIINEKEYTNDIVIWPDSSITKGSEDMHSLRVSDFEVLFNSGLKKVVIGTGDEGKMEWDFSRKVQRAIKAKGIEMVMMDTHELVIFLNENQQRNFLTLVHLNC